ncbi:hypothetical protein UlMin_014565 [Ulmus minor]
MRDFENLKMKDNDTAKDYYSRIKELVNQMMAYRENITDKKIVEKILISCTEKYDSVIFAIKESKDIETLIPTDLMRNENTSESAFQYKINMQSQKSKVGGRKTQENFKNRNQDKYFENKSNFPPCGICNKKGHLEKDCWFKPKPQCRNCKKIWAYRKDCRLKRNHQANFSKEKEGNYLFHEKVPLPLILKKEKVKMQENMCFPIQWRYTIDTARKAQVDESWLWHIRFGHFNFHGLKILRQKNMMKDLPTIKEMDETSIYIAVYLLNRCPTNAVKDKTLVEAWRGRKPSAKHLKVFGCICYTHILQEKRSKLDEKTEKGIFLGYSIQPKGYRVYSLRTKKLIISRDVQFDEDAMYNWETEKIERKSINLPASPQKQQEEEETDQPRSPTQTSTEQPTHQDDSTPESSPRKMRSLSGIYESCNLTIMEPESYEAASKQEVWKNTMEEEINMIKKNETWELANCPQDKKVIGG